MELGFLYGREEITLRVPDDTIVYGARFPAVGATAASIVSAALRAPVHSPPLTEALKARRAGSVAVVVSDITRPIPYAAFLPGVLEAIESAGVRLIFYPSD